MNVIKVKDPLVTNDFYVANVIILTVTISNFKEIWFEESMIR